MLILIKYASNTKQGEGNTQHNQLTFIIHFGFCDDINFPEKDILFCRARSRFSLWTLAAEE